MSAQSITPRALICTNWPTILCTLALLRLPTDWGLRKYAGNQDLVWGNNGSTWRGALGLEPTPEIYVQHVVEVCREIKRVLRPDGTFWLNIGDSYAGGSGCHKGGSDKQNSNEGATNDFIPNKSGNGLKPKDLVLIPERLALALQADGWWVRSRICWNKPNPMPESVTDRPTDSWEHIWMLTKSARYYFDMEAVKEKGETDPEDKAKHGFGGGKNNEANSLTCHTNQPGKEWQWTPTRNLRSVWSFPTAPFKGAHFATFPPKLPELCIKAGTSEKGCCAECGSPWVRIVNKPPCPHTGYTEDKNPDPEANGRRIALMRQAAREQGHEYVNETATLGWKPTCNCNADVIPCTVLDPFTGSGTTLQVAAELGRRAVGYEISEEYCRLIAQRNAQGVIL